MRVLEFFLYIRLTDMGWPRKKGSSEGSTWMRIWQRLRLNRA